MRGRLFPGRQNIPARARHRNLHRPGHSLVTIPSELPGLECCVVCVDTAGAVAGVAECGEILESCEFCDSWSGVEDQSSSYGL